MARRTCFSAAILLLLLSCTGISGRSAPAPAPSSFELAPVPAPAPAPEKQCDCNPSVMALSGKCVPFRLASKWACDVDPNAPLPFYPRPQMTRGNNDTWVSLNGIWEWEPNVSWEEGQPPFNRTLDHNIVVPYPVRSDLSGVVAPYNVGVSRMWYRRHLKLPSSWQNLHNASRTLLHFGGVDWECEVWLNKVAFPVHQGGYDKFNVDITDALKKGKNGVHELIVRVYDPTDSAHIPLGKQRRNPAPMNIWYTGTEGIWQSVWLERVPDAFISRLDMIPNVDAQKLRVTVQGNKAALGLPVQVTAFEAGKKVSSAVGVMGSAFNLSVPNPRLWWPRNLGEPFNYDIEVSLYAAANSTAPKSAAAAKSVTNFATQEPVDTVKGYFGMRKGSLAKLPNDGPLFIHLNNKAIVQVGLLDQGFWPDGLHTAPTDEALCYDMQVAINTGFTTLRKHIKVEPDRWYSCADRLGILVWQDMPVMYWEDPFNSGISYRAPKEKAQHQHELQRMVEEHQSSPSIVQYYTFNEGWGQYDTQRIVQFAHAQDPSRLWGPTSGWVDPQDQTFGLGSVFEHYSGYVGDIRDDHAYPGPYSSGATKTRASVNGEYGGLCMYSEGHSWNSRDQSILSQNDGRGMDNSTMLQARFIELLHDMRKLVKASTGLSGAIYTQMADVESEVNGILTYDRKVLKFDNPALVREEIKKVLNALED